MKRDISALATNQFDIVIIGGGIHGAVIAYELAAVGYKTAIVDKNDFASATSSNSLKIIHGGIRYLQDLDFLRMRESIISRRYFLAHAPNLVKTLPCIMPVKRNSKIRPFMFKVALTLNDLISRDRNRGLPERQKIPRSRFLPGSKVARAVPAIAEDTILGGLFWHDALALDPQRLVLDFVQKAVSYGAVAANYVDVRALNRSQNHVRGVAAKCRMSGRTFNIRSKVVVNCTGPWIHEIAEPESMGRQPRPEYALAMNMVVEPLLSDRYAVGLEGQGGYQKEGSLMKKAKRLFFFVPWHGKTMIGTYYRKYYGKVNNSMVTTDDLNAFLNDIHAVYPAADITPQKIKFYHAGLVPIRSKGDNDSAFTLKKHTKIIDHEKIDGLKGLISIDSTKYTTAAATAMELKTLLLRKREKAPKSGVSVNVANRAYAVPERDMMLFNHLPLKTDAVQRFITEEMAMTLDDVIFRRSNLGELENLQDDFLWGLAKSMGDEFGWDENKIIEEINTVKNYFSPLTALKETIQD